MGCIKLKKFVLELDFNRWMILKFMVMDEDSEREIEDKDEKIIDF